MTRRKCKENYEVDNGELYFRKSGRGSKKGPQTECNDVWKKCIWTIEEKDRVLTSVHGSATGIYIYILCAL